MEWEQLTEKQKAGLKFISENSFIGFHRAFFQMTQNMKWKMSWHHKYIGKYIQDLVSGKMLNNSLLISVPPGSGKTELLSISAPAWGNIVLPKQRNLYISFSSDLSKRSSIRTKEMIKSTPYQHFWPCGFGVDKAEEWQTLTSSNIVKTELFARSMNGQITGSRGGFMGADYSGAVFIDDPNKPSDMHSTVRRKRDQRQLVDTIFSRRADKTDEHPTPLCIIQQRVHVEDITGFILAGGLGKKFKYTHIVIPALIDQEYIDSLPDWIRQDCIDDICHTEQINGYWSFCPSMFGVQGLIDAWESNPYVFMSQYMQKPFKLGGSIINPDWFKDYGDQYDEITEMDMNGNSTQKRVLLADTQYPRHLDYRFITADVASKTGTINDYTVFAEWGVKNERLFLLDYFRDKLEYPEMKKAFIDFIDKTLTRNVMIFGSVVEALVEDKVSGTALIQDVKSESRVNITPVQRNTDKFTRAVGVSSFIKNGGVYIPYEFEGERGKKEVFLSEISEFSADDTHAHDDICDNLFDAVEYVISGKANGSISSIFDDIFS